VVQSRFPDSNAEIVLGSDVHWVSGDYGGIGKVIALRKAVDKQLTTLIQEAI
jgi:hypothetical protein